MSDRMAKDELYDGFARVAKALANGRRAEIVDLLAQGGRSVEEIALEIGQSIGNTSQHLQVLARSGLVRTRREGTRIFYHLSDEGVGRLWTAVRDVAAVHVAGIERLAAAYLGDRSGLETLTRADLLERMQEGTVVLLDVRPAAEYRSGHIPSARSVPLDRLPAEVDRVPAGAEVVAYCRGPYCIYADEAVRELHRAGRRARRLEDGFPEWRHAGLPVATLPGVPCADPNEDAS